MHGTRKSHLNLNLYAALTAVLYSTGHSFGDAPFANAHAGKVLLHHFGCGGDAIDWTVGLGRRRCGDSASFCTFARPGA
jgi:hypothetical protein